jgi:tetratricopeptide (TPR) repeat protein
MAEQSTHPTPMPRWSSALEHVRRCVLLVPEGPVILALAVLGMLIGGAPLVGLLVATVLLALVIRIGALYLGRTALERAHYTEAVSMSQLALALNPWSADALALRGLVVLTSGLIDEAAYLLERSITLLPGNADTVAALAGARLGQGYWSAARSMARNAIELNPGCAIAYLYLAEAERAAGLAPLDVEDTLRGGLLVARRPDDEAALRCALAGLLLSLERTAETALVLGGVERLLGVCSPVFQSRLRLRYGELLLAQGQIEKAREYLNDTLVFAGGGPRSAACRPGQS